MENDYKIIDDIVFIGCTLWTNCTFDNSSAEELKRKFDMYRQDSFKHCMYDKDVPFSYIHYIKMFNTSMEYIKKTAAKFPDKKIVLITHHSPSKKCIAKEFEGHWVNDFFASDIDDELIKIKNLKLIIHGHVHQSHHYKIGDIDVICNPLGRPLIFPNEGKHFDKDLIIEI